MNTLRTALATLKPRTAAASPARPAATPSRPPCWPCCAAPRAPPSPRSWTRPVGQQHTVRGFFAGLKKKGITVDVLERVRQVGPGKQGAKGSYTVYRVAEAG